MVATIRCLRKGGDSTRPCTLQADGRTNWRCCHSYFANLVTGPSGEGTASLYHPWFSCEYCTMQHESVGCQTSKGLGRSEVLATYHAISSPARTQGDAVLLRREGSASMGVLLHVDGEEVGSARPLERIGCALILVRVRALGVDFSEDPFHVPEEVHAVCVCAAVSSFSKLFMFHLPKKGVSGRLLLQLGPKIHGPSETVGLCVTTDSFALLQNTMLFSERIIVNLTMMDSSHLPLLQPSAYRCTGGCCSHARRVRPCLGRGDR